jgi:hypothetical protein
MFKKIAVWPFIVKRDKLLFWNEINIGFWNLSFPINIEQIKIFHSIFDFWKPNDRGIDESCFKTNSKCDQF